MTDVRTPVHQPFYLTFGLQYEYETHPYWAGADPSGWVKILAKNSSAAEALARAYFGDRYAFLYPATHFDISAERKHFAKGELAVIEQGSVPLPGNPGNAPQPIVTTSEPELYGVLPNATVACRIEGRLKGDPTDSYEKLGYDVRLFHRTCVERGKDMFDEVFSVDRNVRAFELDWAVPCECPVCEVSLT